MDAAWHGAKMKGLQALAFNPTGMEPDSGSMTPPVSPGQQVNLWPSQVYEPTDINFSPLFACGSWQGRFTCSIPESVPYIRIFGRAFFRKQFSETRIQDAFWAARVRFSELFSSAQGHSTASGIKRAQKLQQEVSTFFSYLRHEIERLLDCPDLLRSRPGLEEGNYLSLSGLCVTVLDEMKQTLLFIGPISDLPECALFAAQGSSGHILLHLSLEAWWTAFHIANMVTTSGILRDSSLDVSFCDLQGPRSDSPFVQVATLLMWDLCSLSCKQYTKDCRSSSDALKSAFPCDCVKQLWAMVAEVINGRQSYHGEEPFWVYLSVILEDLVSGEEIIPKGNIGKFDLSSFSRNYSAKGSLSLWFLSHVAEMFKKVCEECLHRTQEKSNYTIARKLVQLAIAEQDEQQMRIVVHCCITLHLLWEPAADLLVPLTEFFLKNLNSSFQLSTNVSGLLQICRSGQQFHQLAKQRTEMTTARPSDTSYELFLTLLVRCLTKCFETGATNVWKQLKGRIYSRFHARRIQELTETGLQNSFLLFLVLASCAELEEVVKKMFNLFELLSPTASSSKVSVVLKAMFATLLALQERGIDLEWAAGKVASWFFSRCLETPEKCSDAALLQQRSALIPVYLEGMTDIFDASSDFGRSEYVLIAPQMKQLLEQSSQSEQSAILGALQEGIEKFRMVFRNCAAQSSGSLFQSSLKEQHTRLSHAIYSSVLPFIYRAVSTTTTLPQQLVVDTAAAVALIALLMPSSVCIPIKVNFLSLFEYFGCSVQVNPRVSSRFLSLVLAEGHAKEHLMSHMPNFESQLIRAWLRCCMMIPPPCDHTTQLSRMVIQLKEATELTMGTMPAPEGGHDRLVISFFRCLGEARDILECMNDAKGMTNLSRALQGYLQSSISNITTLLKGAPPSSALLQHVYNVCGELFKYCAPLLYTRGEPGCCLPELLRCLLLSSAVVAKNALPQAQVLAVKQHLPLFLDGMLSFNLKTDPYLQRNVKEIILYYLPLFSLTQNPVHNTGPHPLLVMLDAAEGHRLHQKTKTYVMLLVECISENFLSRKGTAHAQCGQAVSFLQVVMKLLKSCPGEYHSTVAIFLPSLLEYLLSSAGNTRPCQDLLTSVLQECRRRPSTAEEKQCLVSVISTFVQKNLAWNTSSVFRLLKDIATLHPQLISSAMSDIMLVVKQVEEKRGAGSDRTIRNHLSALIAHTENSKSAALH